MEDQYRDEMVLEEVPAAKGQLDCRQARVVLLYRLNQVPDAVLAVLIFDIDIKLVNLLDLAYSLGVEEQFALKLPDLLIRKHWLLLFFLVVVLELIHLEVVAINLPVLALILPVHLGVVVFGHHFYNL